MREYARIQSFPDEWEFSGGVGAQYRQIGIAVPVNLAKYIGKSLVHYLNQFN
ncbi:DNA cytosine methyltransferase [Streptococcus dysgalactiae]|uniref:DNA cytosine methyltransferase n=1 Tax=Streptococcus dysgalactiae TaxID=1334 RepID=UPI0021CC996E